jgi:hypothetical protein
VPQGRETTEDGLVQTTSTHVSDDFFRQVNDRIVELGKRFGLREEVHELICECDDAGCTERLHVPASEYEYSRRAQGWHVVAAGHEPSGRIVARGLGYVVVED